MMQLKTLLDATRSRLENGYIYSEKGQTLAIYDNGLISGMKDEKIPVEKITHVEVEEFLGRDFFQIETAEEKFTIKAVSVGEELYVELLNQERVNLSYAELDDLFPIIYPRGVGFWNELFERPFITFGDVDNPLPYCTEMKAKIFSDFEKRLKSIFPYKPCKCSKVAMYDTVISKMFESKKNPFRDWLEELPPWDGIERIGTFFRDTLGASSGLDPEMDRTYQKRVLEAWMIGVVARQYEIIKFEILPCLIGSQGLGKSTVCELLSPEIEWYMSTSSTIDREEEFLKSLSGHILVEFGEGRTLKAEPDKLKEFLSRAEDSYRPSYGQYAGTFKRHWGAIITTNDPTPLADSTGARRFYPIYCWGNADLMIFDVFKEKEAIREHVLLMWAEALARYHAGEKWYISEEIGQTAVQESASRINIEAMLVNSRLDAYPEFRHEGARITPLELYRIVWGDDVDVSDKSKKNTIHTWLSDKSCPWEGKVFYDSAIGKSQRGYVRRVGYDNV